MTRCPQCGSSQITTEGDAMNAYYVCLICRYWEVFTDKDWGDK